MTKYIDLAALGPTREIATLRAKLFGREGYLVDTNQRQSLAECVKEGDTIYTRPHHCSFWRQVPIGVEIVDAETGTVDPIENRTEGIAFYLTRYGLTPTEARNLVKKPPKGENHQHWDKYWWARRVWLNHTHNTTLENLASLEYLGEQVRVEGEPFTWEVVSAEEMRGVVRQAARDGVSLGIDVETNLAGATPNETRDSLVGFAVSVGNHCYYTQYEGTLIPLLLTPWMGHNSKYDYVILQRHGFRPGSIIGDGMLAAYLLGEREAGLKALVQEKYGHRMQTYEEVLGKEERISDVPIEKVAKYCCADAWWGKRVAIDLEAELERHENKSLHGLYKKVDLPLVRILGDMEIRGVKVDRESIATDLAYAGEGIITLDKVLDTLASQDGYTQPLKRRACPVCHNGSKKKLTCDNCKGAGGFDEPVKLNPGSHLQIAEWLHNKVGLPIQATSRKTGQPSMSAMSLLRMRDLHSAIPLLLVRMGQAKYMSFLEDWFWASKEDSRLHTTFTNSFVRSGRLSSREPNLQQVSLEWRKHFVCGS